MKKMKNLKFKNKKGSFPLPFSFNSESKQFLSFGLGALLILFKKSKLKAKIFSYDNTNFTHVENAEYHRCG